MRRLVLILILISLIPHQITADIQKIDEIAVFEGIITRDIPGQNTSIIPIQNFEYLPGWLIYLEYRLTTNASSYFTEISYANTMRYRSVIGTQISYMSRVELNNNSYENGLYTLGLYGTDKQPVYLTAEIIPDTNLPSHISINYKIIILEKNEDQALDETLSYTGEVNYYPSTVAFRSSYIGANNDDIHILMPHFTAKNESRLPENYYYIMDIRITFIVQLLEEKETEFRFSIPPFSREVKIDIESNGQFELLLEEMENREIQNLNIYHNGADAVLTVISIEIDIPALVEIPVDLITPESIKISAGMVAIMTSLISYKIVSSYGKSKIKNAREELL